MIGRQTPTFEVCGEYDVTYGPEAVELFESYGFGFDAAQRHEMDVYLARIDGRPAAITVGLSIPRQNGKSYAARWYAVWCAAVLGLIVVYSAHNGDTISEFFTMVTEIFEDEENYPDFAEMLDGSPYRQPGKESIRFVSGGRIRFMTRTNNKSRSSTCDVLIIDEAQELTEAQINAILPVVSAGPHGMPQIIYVGTPPDPTCQGTVFRRMHDRAHDGTLGRGWWMEWAISSLPPEGATKDELMDLAYMTNPALGVRITEEAVENEIDSMSLDGLARERFGWWDMNSNGVQHVLTSEEWSACETDDPPADGLMAVGVKFAPDGSRVALAACLRPDEGNPYVEVVKSSSTSRGTRWVAEWLDARRDKIASVAIDGKRGESTVQKLADLKFPKRAVRVPGTADMAKANSMLVEAVQSGSISHYGQPDLDAAATTCDKRRIGQDGFGFDDTETGDSTLIEACALAYREAMTTKRRPGRKAVVY